MKSFALCLTVLLLSICPSMAQQTQPASLLGEKMTPEADWKTFIHKDYKAIDSKVTFDRKANTFTAMIGDTSTLEKSFSYGLQIYKNIDLDQDATYEATFKTKSTVEGKLQFRYILGKSPYHAYAAKSVDLKEGEQTHKITFAPKAVKDTYDTPGSFRFFVGSLGKGEIEFSDLVLTQVEK